jgi:hypothetical protein
MSAVPVCHHEVCCPYSLMEQFWNRYCWCCGWNRTFSEGENARKATKFCLIPFKQCADMRKLKTGAVTVSIVRFNVFVCCPIRKYLPDLVGLKREKEERVESRRHNPGDQTDFATLQQLAVSLCVCAIVFVSLQNESSECDSLEDSLDSLTHTSARPSYVSVSQEEERAVRAIQVYAVNKLAPLTIHYDKLMHIHR